MDGTWEPRSEVLLLGGGLNRQHPFAGGGAFSRKHIPKQGELLRPPALVALHGYDFWRKTKPPFLLPITMSTFPSPFRSPTENCVPTPESLSMR